MTHVFADGLNLGVVVGLPSALPAEPYATCEEAGPKSALEGSAKYFFQCVSRVMQEERWGAVKNSETSVVLFRT